MTSAAPEKVRGNRKSRVGQVVSDVQNKTIVVEFLFLEFSNPAVEFRIRHIFE